MRSIEGKGGVCVKILKGGDRYIILLHMFTIYAGVSKPSRYIWSRLISVQYIFNSHTFMQ